MAHSLEKFASRKIMNETKNTDITWEEWGFRDPYYGTITNPKFRRANLDEYARAEFFETGRLHVEYVMNTIHTHIDLEFRPKSIIDFGCGVGRLAIPFARIAEQVVGLDVSQSMLNEALINCEAFGLKNVVLVLSDDEITRLTQKGDLVHSFIVFQHISPDRGRVIFRRLLDLIAPGGVGAIHFLYGKRINSETCGMPLPESKNTPRSFIKRVMFSGADPEAARLPDTDPDLQMFPYILNHILYLIQSSGITKLHIECTDHGGELGAYMFFRKH
jgi:SAM-dependent methyltransferase